MLILPIFSDSTAHQYDIDLDGRPYTLRFVYDDRSDGWTMDLSTVAGEPLATGVALVTGVSLLRNYPNSDGLLPPGMLSVVDLNRRAKDPGRYDFDTRSRLIYFEESDLDFSETPDFDVRIELQ